MYGQLVTLWLVPESGGKQPDDAGCECHTEGRDHQQEERQGAGDVGCQVHERLAVTGLAVLGKHRHKGLGESALGKQTAQEVGDLEGHQKHVGDAASAKDNGQHLIAHKTQNARYEGHQTDDSA